MDRKAWIAISLSVVGLFAWQWYVGAYLTPPKQPSAAAVPSATPGAPEADAKPAAAPSASPVSTASGAPPNPVSAPVMTARAESLPAGKAEFVFNNDAGGIEQVILLLHLGENQQSVSLNRDRGMPIGALGFQPGEVTGGFEMTTDRAKREVTFSKSAADGLQITKRFTLPPDSENIRLYTVNLEVSFRNSGTTELQVPPFYISTGGAAPIHQSDLPMYTRFDWSAGSKMTTIDVNWFSPSTIPILGIQTRGERPLYLESKANVQWAAVTSQYFCTIVTTKDPASSVWARRFDTKKQNNTPVFGIQGAIGQGGFSVPPGSTVTKTFEIYAGPKELTLLRKIGGNQDAVLNFGMFGFISEFLLWAMNTLHGWFGNYAASIIVLTLLIKTGLWPIQNKATNEMRKMSLLAPKMTELKEKYKDDPQKMNEETMKLYREYGVNPFSGCLPMLIQIPIFFGFYSMLGTAIELRNSSFFWIHDLSQPDTIGHILGFPINLLPIIMSFTMVWQMIITPKSGDAAQQRILYFMPIIFLIFAYNYASGLSLYWTTQNIFSIVQLYLTRNKPLPTLEKKSVIAKREAAKNSKKKRP
ncbi:MAG: membrane protein insertase YidC [Chthoniobacterales bacterium]|nr:membrane protein insertase YidC [Chthoniobacterales bacterium]